MVYLKTTALIYILFLFSCTISKNNTSNKIANPTKTVTYFDYLEEKKVLKQLWNELSNETEDYTRVFELLDKIILKENTASKYMALSRFYSNFDDTLNEQKYLKQAILSGFNPIYSPYSKAKIAQKHIACQHNYYNSLDTAMLRVLWKTSNLKEILLTKINV